LAWVVCAVDTPRRTVEMWREWPTDLTYTQVGPKEDRHILSGERESDHSQNLKFSLLTNRSRIADERKSLLNSLYILGPFIYYGILIDFPPEFLWRNFVWGYAENRLDRLDTGHLKRDFYTSCWVFFLFEI
jgi:hypothetical protein